MAWCIFFVALLTFVLYAHRTGQLLRDLHWGERFARIGVGILLASLVYGYFDLAHDGEPLILRQWLVAAGLLVTAVGYAWLNLTDRHR